MLDNRGGPVRARVKLTPSSAAAISPRPLGSSLLDRALNPQPDPGEPYQGSASGSGKPTAYGTQNVCVFLEDSYKEFANDTTDYQVNVSAKCTAAAARYDKAATALTQAQQHSATPRTPPVVRDCSGPSPGAGRAPTLRSARRAPPVGQV